MKLNGATKWVALSLTVLSLIVCSVFSYATTKAGVDRNAERLTEYQQAQAEKMREWDALLADQSKSIIKVVELLGDLKTRTAVMEKTLTRIETKVDKE